MTTGASARCVRVAGVEELLGYKCFGGRDGREEGQDVVYEEAGWVGLNNSRNLGLSPKHVHITYTKLFTYISTIIESRTAIDVSKVIHCLCARLAPKVLNAGARKKKSIKARIYAGK